MNTLIDWTFEVTTRYGRPSVKLTNNATGYSTYGTLWSDMGVGYDAADISSITSDVHAQVKALLTKTEV